MPRTVAKAPQEVDVMRSLLHAGLELGIAEAARRLASVLPVGPDRLKKVEVGAALAGAAVTEVVQAIRNDPNSVFQLVKEVWSRGGKAERRTAARAVGHGLGKMAPHQALGLSRDLAAMSRDGDEADTVGLEAIKPILEAAPPLIDRVKGFIMDNERWVRRAAIAGLVAYVTQRKRLAGLALEAILLVAEHNEKEIRDAVSKAVKELSKVDWKTTAKTLSAWAQSDTTGQRVALAKKYAAATAASARKGVERIVVEQLAKIANGNGATKKRPKVSR